LSDLSNTLPVFIDEMLLKSSFRIELRRTAVRTHPVAIVGRSLVALPISSSAVSLIGRDTLGICADVWREILIYMLPGNVSNVIISLSRLVA
jgi:hypothetical protein